MKILVVGSGGREHAIIWKLAQCKQAEKIFCAPGNSGIAEMAECVDIMATDIEGLADFAVENKIDFTVVGMDEPLVMGIVDVFNGRGLRIFGPSKAAAIVEGSKAYSKEFMKKYHIPTADSETFSSYEEALAYIRSSEKFPLVVKADGLALGKGVLICSSVEEAERALADMFLDKKFGASGEVVVIEEFLTGHEVSVLSFCDGKTIVPMVSAQDHKRACDNDEGLNTGGMGTFSPSRYYTADIDRECLEKIYKPTVEGLQKENREFKGIIFFGLMLTAGGVRVIEYNARFGDPETQVVLPRLENDLLEIMLACENGTLDNVDIKWKNNAAACVILASGGYPEKYNKGYEIKGINIAHNSNDVLIFHAGTIVKNGKFYTNGGRVLGVTGIGENLDEAIRKAYGGVDQIYFKDIHFRKDIGIK